MFSYLRPRSRHGANNQPNTPESPASSAPKPDYQSRFPSSQQSSFQPPTITQSEEPYVSPISARAPTLPPIPRVASIYGPPPGYNVDDDQQSAGGPSSYTGHSRVHSIEEHRVSPNIESSPKSSTSITSNRPRSNFSRPFHGREGSLTPSEERAALQEIWRSATQSAQQNENQHVQGKRPQPFLNTDVARKNVPVESLSASNARIPRMPFQDEDNAPSKSKNASHTRDQLMPSPHIGRASEEMPPPSYSPATAYSRTPLNMPSESKKSLPITRTAEAVSPSYKSSGSASSSIPPPSKPSRFTRLNPISLLTRRRASQPSQPPEMSTYRRDLMLGSTLPQDYVGIRGNRVHDFSAPRPPRKVISQQTMTSRSSDKSPDNANDLLHVRTVSRDESSSLSVPSTSPERRSASPSGQVPTPEASEDKGKNVLREAPYSNLDQNTGFGDQHSSSPSEYSGSESDFSSDLDETSGDPLLLGDPTFGLFSAPEGISEPPQSFSFIVPKHLAGPPAPPRTPRSRSQTPIHDRSPKGRPYTPPPAPRSPRSRSQTPSNSGRSPRDPRAPRSASTPPLRESRTPSPQFGHLPRHSKSNASRFSFDLAGFGSSVQEKLLEDKARQKLSKDMRASKISQMSVPESEDGYDSDDPDLGADWEEEVPGMGMDEDDFPMSKSIANSTLDSTAKQKSPEKLAKPSLYTHQNVAMDSERPSEDVKEVPKPSKSFILRSSMFKTTQVQVNPGDDFYFDDGVIEDADLQATGSFDESVFDDPSHRIGQHIQPTLAAVPEQRSQESSLPSTRPMSLESSAATGPAPQTSNDTSRASLPPTQPWDKTHTAKRSSMLKNDLTATREIQTTLTQGNLEAYHDALALAAHKAATEGRFDRDVAVDDRTHTDPKAAVSLGGHVNQSAGLAADDPNTYDDFQDKVMFDDYEQEDDDVIAAANADALGYDAEFYGEEFHFYSTGEEGEESQYGGVFVNDIKRSHSGRANGQEPSLTPITETSEWSTRNSMVAMDRAYTNPVQQPGLAQIADSLRDEDTDMSLSSLKRLRQNAFAGSNSSLGSGGSGKNGSPPSSSSQVMPHLNAGQNKPQHERSHPLRTQTLDSDDIIPASPQTPSDVRRTFVKGHSRNSSGAESVTYVQENDADQGKRWVLERRRTTEDGSVEVLGRQVVEGGRI